MKLYEFHLSESYGFLGEDGRDPYLTCIIPENIMDKKARTAILILPGGAYAFCSDREAEPIAHHFLTEGYPCFILWYSCAPHTYPCQMREVAASMKLICEHSEEWCIDREKIALFGFSAGAHLAAHYANRYDCLDVRSVIPDSIAPGASVLAYPVISAEPGISHASSIENLLGHGDLTSEEIEEFSCEKMVTPHTPPTFIWTTCDDGIVPCVNSIVYVKSLSENKVPFEFHVFPKGGHGLATADNVTCAKLSNDARRVGGWFDLANKWLQMIFA